jgi:mono/diheme cytochrome c family protein
MQSFFIRASLATSLVFAAGVLAATPALADEPGGVTKLAPPVTGEQVYTQVCQACHMADAKGGGGAAMIPALANNPRLGAAAYPIIMVVKGRGAMPSLTDLLAPAQIANVVGYIRTHFGNNYPGPVTEADVLRIEEPKHAH